MIDKYYIQTKDKGKKLQLSEDPASAGTKVCLKNLFSLYIKKFLPSSSIK
jgi:hypothetical protein